MTRVRSVAFDELELGQTARLDKSVTDEDIRAFAALSGDTNPIHLDEAYARGTRFEGRIAHGMLVGAHISTALATRLPGPGTIFLAQTLRFERPVRPGDELSTHLEVTAKDDRRGFATLACRVENQNGETVVTGEARVMVPRTPVEVDLPDPASVLGAKMD